MLFFLFLSISIARSCVVEWFYICTYLLNCLRLSRGGGFLSLLSSYLRLSGLKCFAVTFADEVVTLLLNALHSARVLFKAFDCCVVLLVMMKELSILGAIIIWGGFVGCGIDLLSTLAGYLACAWGDFRDIGNGIDNCRLGATWLWVLSAIFICSLNLGCCKTAKIFDSCCSCSCASC